MIRPSSITPDAPRKAEEKMTAAMTPEQILAASRLQIYSGAPYFRAGVLQLVFRETPDLGTVATTKNWIVLWDPKKILEWGVEETAGAIVHELWHLTRDHFTRFSAPLVNQDVANIAGDLSINPGVIEMGFQLPPGGLFPSKFEYPDGLTAEQYYALLLKDPKIKWHYVAGDKDEEGDPNSTPMKGCGSCSGRPVPNEPGDGDAEGRSESEIKRTRQTIAKAIQQLGRGSVPSELSRWANEELKPPKIRWEEKLARACRAAVSYRPGGGYTTYAKQSRRQAGIGYGVGKPMLPGVRSTTPRVTFLMDTSGSMSQDQLMRAMGEASAIFKACGASLDMVVCDARVHGSKRVRSIKEACAMLKGGGGSDFRPAFAQISKTMPKNDIIVAATDGDICVPSCEPAGQKVIWLLIGDHANIPCSWGTVIRVET